MGISNGWYIYPEVLNLEDISLVDKIILSLVKSYSKNGPCNIQTDVIANEFFLSTRQVQRILKRLKEGGFITKDNNYRFYYNPVDNVEHDGIGVFVPKEIARVDNLIVLDKLVLSYINQFSKKDHEKVWITNGHIRDRLGISSSYVSQIIGRLVEEDYLNRVIAKNYLYANKSLRTLWISKENWNNIKANQRKDINTNGKSTHQKGMELLKKAWNRQNLHHKGTKWYTQDERKENAVWSQFAESLLYTAQMKGFFDFGLTFDEQDKRRRKAEVINTHYIELIERLMYIYFYERENIFFEKPEEAYTPQEFCSYYCIYRLVNSYYREYYGNTIKEHGYQIMNYYTNNNVGEQLNPAEIDIIVSSLAKETV